MARKSFIIHIDSLDVLDELTDEDAGKLFKAIKAYHCAQQYEVNQLLKIALIPFKSQFSRDEDKYNNTCKKNKINGLKGGRPSKPKEPSGLSGNPTEPKKADSKSKSDNDSKNKKEEEPPIPPFEIFWKYYTPIKASDGKVVPKGSRQKATIAYKRALQGGAEHNQIMRGLELYLKQCLDTDTLSCQAVTFLNQQRYKDDYNATYIASKLNGTAGKTKTERLHEATAKGLASIL